LRAPHQLSDAEIILAHQHARGGRALAPADGLLWAAPNGSVEYWREHMRQLMAPARAELQA
jgi:hypothetical protein